MQFILSLINVVPVNLPYDIGFSNAVALESSYGKCDTLVKSTNFGEENYQELDFPESTFTNVYEAVPIGLYSEVKQPLVLVKVRE